MSKYDWRHTLSYLWIWHNKELWGKTSTQECYFVAFLIQKQKWCFPQNNWKKKIRSFFNIMKAGRKKVSFPFCLTMILKTHGRKIFNMIIKNLSRTTELKNNWQLAHKASRVLYWNTIILQGCGWVLFVVNFHTTAEKARQILFSSPHWCWCYFCNSFVVDQCGELGVLFSWCILM